MRILPLSLTLLLVSTAAHTYPTDVIFTPTGEAKALGSVGLLAYSGTILSPHVAPGSSCECPPP